jgi:hypothetical protein
MGGRAKRGTTLVLAMCLATALTSIALAAPITSVIFGASHGKAHVFFMLDQKRGKFYVTSFALACEKITASTSSQVNAKLPVKRSGAFSYNGPGFIETGTSPKGEKTTFKISGQIHFAGGRRTLSSAKTATISASNGDPHKCPSVKATIKGIPAGPDSEG